MQEMWDNYKMLHMHNCYIFEGEEWEKKTEVVSELIMGENFPELMADTKQ